MWKLDRAFLSVLDGASTLQALTAAGCGLRSLQEPWINTTTAIGEALYHSTLAWAQLEKRQIAERVKAGMDRAYAEGISIGRPRRTADVTAHPQWAKVLAAVGAGHLTRAEAAKKLHVRRTTLAAVLAGVPKDFLWDRGRHPPAERLPPIFVQLFLNPLDACRFRRLSSAPTGCCLPRGLVRCTVRQQRRHGRRRCGGGTTDDQCGV